MITLTKMMIMMINYILCDYNMFNTIIARSILM